MSENYETAGIAVKGILDRIKSYREEVRNDQMRVQTGYQQLDSIIGGFYPGEIAVIAGRPSMGKTAFALNIVRNLAIQSDKAVGFLSLGEDKDTIAEKLLTMDSTVDFTSLRTKDLSVQNMKELEESADRIAKAKLYISDCANADVASICLICKAMKKDHDVKIVFIDYAQLIKDSGEGSEALEMANILIKLKDVARELQIPIVLLSQLSREVDERVYHKPTVTDFPVKEVIEYMTDTILFIYRDDYYNLNSDMKGIAEIIVAKHGNVRAGTAKLVWNPVNYRFC